MRPIDADALKELFSEVIGHIAKKPEMNGNLEHMIRASAMVIQMIDDAPTVQPYTTTHDSIPAETGENDGDGTSGDCISRQQAIEAVGNMLRRKFGIGGDLAEITLACLPSVQPETNCSEIPNNSDTISRQAVTKFLNDWLSCLFENCHKQSASDLKMIIKDFKNLPSAQPERKTGRWIPDNTDYYRTKFICSACGESEEVPTTGFGYGTMWDYCPMCGAKMKAGE